LRNERRTTRTAGSGAPSDADAEDVTWDDAARAAHDVHDLVVSRWRTHDENRLYVSTPSGEPVGWVDLDDGARHLDRPELEDRFDVTVAMHVALEHVAYLPAAED
jgi:hypothetical protein